MKTFKFDSYGEAFGHGDIIGCLLDRKKNEIVFYKNGKDLGIAFRLPQNTNKMPLYALLCLKNAEVAVNFSGPFKYPPQVLKNVSYSNLNICQILFCSFFRIFSPEFVPIFSNSLKNFEICIIFIFIHSETMF